MIKRFHFNDEYTGPHTGGEYVKYDDYAASERAREEAEAERDRLREKNKVLHRRCQHAEKGVAEKIKEPHRGSFGRGLANAAASMFRARAEGAEARLRAVLNLWHTAGVDCATEQYVMSLHNAEAINQALSGDLPPCPGCAKANAKLAAVGREIDDLMSDVDDYDEDDLYAEGFANSTKSIAKMIRNELASDPEVIAVVDGWYKGNRDNPFLIDRHSHGEYFPLSTVPGKGAPVTVTVTRKGEGE